MVCKCLHVHNLSRECRACQLPIVQPYRTTCSSHGVIEMEDSEAESEFVGIARAFQKAFITAQNNEQGEPLPPYKRAGFYLHGVGRITRFAVGR